MDIAKMKVNEWEFSVSSEKLAVSPDVQRQAKSLIADWTKAVVVEPNWARQQHGVASVLVRLDGTIDTEGQFRCYEVEERPAGVGCIRHFVPDFRERVDVWKKMLLDQLVSVVSPLREKGCDDTEWLPVLSMDEAKRQALPVIVRAEPEETSYHSLQAQSISSVVTKGDRSYGERMGLWQRYNRGIDLDLLPWETGFVAKATGSKCRTVWIWSPEKQPGCLTRSRMRKTLEQLDSFVVQPLHLPEFVPINGTCFSRMIRLYAGYFHHQQFELLGGAWCARPKTLKLHGASDAIFGPLQLV